MSKFNRYARKMDEIAREAFDEYRKSADALREAGEHNRKSSGMVSMARAEADFLEAEQNHRSACRKMDEGEYRQRIVALRRELTAALDEAFRADPEQIDSKALELLKSGILTPDEYKAMLETAAANGNPTMVRLIGKYAEDAAAAAAEKDGVYSAAATALRAVGYQSQNSNGKAWIDAFDYMVDVYNRACRNPYMIDKWDELTAETVEQF